MNRSTPGLPVHPEFTQTHVHRVSDAIQPSHPLSSPSPPAPNPSQHQSCLTLSDSMDWSLPGSSIHGILQSRILEWVAVPFSLSVQFSRSVVSDSLRSHESQHARPPCPLHLSNLCKFLSGTLPLASAYISLTQLSPALSDPPPSRCSCPCHRRTLPGLGPRVTSAASCLQLQPRPMAFNP